MSAEERNRDQRIVDAVLSEEGLADDGALTAVLMEVRGLANTAAPPMSLELIAALAVAQAPDSHDGADVSGTVVVSLDSRRGRKRRVLIVSAAVLATMGLGVGAAAASNQGFRQAAQHTFSGLVDVLNPQRQAPPALQPVAPVQTGEQGSSGETPAPTSTALPTTPGVPTKTRIILPPVPRIDKIPAIPASPFPDSFVSPRVVPERVSPAPSAAPKVLPRPTEVQLPSVASPLGR